MKHLTYTLSIFICTFFLKNGTAKAQSWNNVGHPYSTTTRYLRYEDIIFDNGGTPYIAYWNDSGGMSTVMKYSDGAWSTIGNTSFTGDIWTMKIAVAPSHILYAAYADWLGWISVMKYTGTEWVFVGPPMFKKALAYSNISFVINNDGIPYVACSDHSNDDMATVLKFNGSEWEPVGIAGFSPGVSYSIDMAIDASGKPYVIYIGGYATGFKPIVQTFDGSSWVMVDSATVSLGEVAIPRIVIGPDNVPFIAYMDDSVGEKIRVMKHGSSGWEQLGDYCSPDTTYLSGFTVDRWGTPYVSYADNSHGNKATVMKYTSGGWSAVGSPGFSDYYASPVITTNLYGTPYIFYSDSAVNRPVVQQFGWPEGIDNADQYTSQISLHPNPNNGSFIVNKTSANSEQITISINNLSGETVRLYNLTTNKDNSINTYLRAGYYILKASGKSGDKVTSFIVQ